MGSLSFARFPHCLQEAGEEGGSSVAPVSCFVNYLCYVARDYKAEQDPAQHSSFPQANSPSEFWGRKRGQCHSQKLLLA